MFLSKPHGGLSSGACKRRGCRQVVVLLSSVSSTTTCKGVESTDSIPYIYIHGLDPVPERIADAQDAVSPSWPNE
ncbi:hypothetical protein N656DRAFT_84518 [Canariomyces notabilis]|uniref:Uncharacterized protein n=1 Tax=Canariomyces notabilis TaxID=2074819 RepID=A0AAN6TDG0_9PEZI|nr:hypothetical protein N656DRAFT_84518 [Canariomyces arenarius]